MEWESDFGTYITKETEQGDPEDEEDSIPDPDDGEAQDEGDEVEQGRYGGEGTDHDSKDLFFVSLLVLVLVSFWRMEDFSPISRRCSSLHF